MTRASAVTRTVALCILTTTASLGGCLALPFVSPPMRMAVSSGSTIGSSDIDGYQSDFQRAFVEVRGAFHPLQVAKRARGRRFDFGLGYFGNFRFSESQAFDTKHGPYLELAYHPWLLLRGRPGSEKVTRLAVIASPELVLAQGLGARHTGAGLRVGLAIEWASFFSGPFGAAGGTGGVVGGGYGELGVGLQLDGGFREIAGERSWSVGGSLVFRLPAAIGVVFGTR